MNAKELIIRVSELASKGKSHDIKTICERCFHASNSSAETLLALADIYRRLGNSSRTEDCYRQVLHLRPDDFISHANFGLFLFHHNRIHDAIISFRHAIKVNPDNSHLHYNLAVALQADGKISEAKCAYAKTIELQPEDARAHANIAFLLRKEGKLDEAVTHYNKAIFSADEMEELHYNLGLTLLQQGKIHEAEQALQRALQLNPEYSDGHSGLGSLYFYLGDYQRSIFCYKKSIKRNPKNIESLVGLTGSLAAIGQYKEAAAIINNALQISPDNVDVLITHGSLLINMGNPAKAAQIGTKILEKHPENKEARLLAAGALEIRGENDKAHRYLKPLLDEEQVDANAGIIFATISKHIGLQEQAISVLERILDSSSYLPSHTRRKIHFTLGDNYDSIHSYDTAYKHYSTGNNLKQAAYDRKQHSTNIENLTRFFNKEYLSNAVKSSIHAERPVFIVGMPRSGTSLTEQILSSHSRVFGAGELSDIKNIVYDMGNDAGSSRTYPEYLRHLDRTAINDISEKYLQHLDNLTSDADFVTDKMPSNFMHLGLIQVLFPHARIIHCKRSPLDTCLSCYFQDFGPSHPYAYSLPNLGHYYKQYQKIMDHWGKSLSIPVLDVQYEELIEDQNTVTMRLLDFCNLDWEDGCLNFQDNKRLIWTASYKQVHQGLYRKSVARWKNYEQHLQKLREALEDK